MTQRWGSTPGADSPSAGTDREIRRRFLQAASVVLEDEGVEKLTIRTVCRLAGLSTHAFYGEFNSKEDLLVGLIEVQYASAAQHFRSNIDSNLAPVAYVKAFVSAMIQYGLEIVLGSAWSIPARRIRALMPDYEQLSQRSILSLLSGLIRALEEGERRGELSSPDPRSDALAIYYLVTSFVMDQPHPEPLDRQELERTLLGFVERGLCIDERSAPTSDVG